VSSVFVGSEEESSDSFEVEAVERIARVFVGSEEEGSDSFEVVTVERLLFYNEIY